MRKRFIKIHASDSSALLLGPRSALQSSSFLPSVSHAGEFHLSRFTHLILRLRYLDLGLLCRSHPSCLQYLMRGRVSPIKVYASDSTAMLFGPRTTLQTSSFLPSVSQQGRVPSIKVYASNSSAMLLGPWSILQTSSFLPSISHAGEILPIKVYPTDFSAMLLGP